VRSAASPPDTVSASWRRHPGPCGGVVRLLREIFVASRHLRIGEP